MRKIAILTLHEIKYYFFHFQNSVQNCHPIMHQMVVNNVSEYLEQNKDLTRYLDRLKSTKKKLFLVTNSPFHFV